MLITELNMIEIFSYDFSAALSYALLDIFILEVILTVVFRNGKDLHFNIGLNDTRNTRAYVIAFGIAGLIFFLVSNTLQNPVTLFLLSFWWRVHVIALGLFGLVTFWVAKIMLSRSWKHSMVKASLIIFVASLVTLIIENFI